jgi:hypothetical protein
MGHSALLLSLLLAVGQAAETPWQLGPQLDRGLELVYHGAVHEDSNSANVQFQRQYRLDTNLFVLEKTPAACTVAVLTALTAQTGGVASDAPLHVRLEVGKLDDQGVLNLGRGPRDLVPLEGPPLLETGFLVEVPLGKVGKASAWDVVEAGRPVRGMRVIGTETCAGISCVKLAGLQQSEDWDHPRADRTAWRRQDLVWLAPHLGVACRVERLIERRDPARQQPTYRCKVHYELSGRPLPFPGKFFEDRQAEILIAKRFQDDAVALFQKSVESDASLEALRRKIAHHVENQPPTPYRRAIEHLAARIDAVRKGETPAIQQVSSSAPTPKRAVSLGQRVPDVMLSDLIGKSSVRLHKLLGRPTLIFYLQPATETGKEVLGFVRTLHKQHGEHIQLVAMAVGPDQEALRKHHAAAASPFPYHDGNAFHLLFGVDATPRFIVLDAQGVVRLTTTGWGFQVPDEIRKSLESCMSK